LASLAASASFFGAAFTMKGFAQYRADRERVDFGFVELGIGTAVMFAPITAQQSLAAAPTPKRSSAPLASGNRRSENIGILLYYYSGIETPQRRAACI
jgi:hypothetical protein